MNTLEGMLGMLADCMRLVWLVPLLPLLAAAAIGMRMLFCRQHGDRHEPLTAGLASGAALGALLLLLLFDLAALLDGVPETLRSGEWLAIGLTGGLLTLGIWIAFTGALAGGASQAHARALAMALLTLASVGTTAALGGLASHTGRAVALCTLASAALLIQVPSLAARLHLEPLDAKDWATAALIVALAALPTLLGRRTARSSPLDPPAGHHWRPGRPRPRQVSPRMRHRTRADRARLPRLLHRDVRPRSAAARC